MSSASGSKTSASESDIEMQSALPALSKKAKKTPKSPSEDLLKNQDPQKMTTKDMIKEALAEQKSRKGISLHAIRKFIIEKHTVNVERITMLIKKALKSGIEEGSFIQTKGIGATGSFKLAPKKKPENGEKPKKKTKLKKSEKTEKAKKTKKEVEEKDNGEKVTKRKAERKTSKVAKKDKAEKKEKPEKKVEAKEKKEKTKVPKTPAKKRAAMMKRKSIGSIIKPPKMKPNART